MKKILILLAVVLPFSMMAQTKSPVIRPYSADEAKENKKYADENIKLTLYNQALPIYQRLQVTSPNDAEINFKLGICYLNTNINKGAAVPYLEYAANANTKEKPKDVTFELAKAYHYAGLYDKALEHYEKFRMEKKGVVDAKLKLDQWIAWSTNAKTITASTVEATFMNLGKGVNSPTPDYRPVMGAADTVIYFSSKRKGNTGGVTDDLGEITSDVYFFTQNDTSRSKAKNAGVGVNTAFYEECLSVNPSGDKMLVYREGPDANGDIYISELSGKTFAPAVSLGKAFITKSLETGATISPDGMTMYFAAEAEGSKTGKDIWRCTRTESTTWSKPERLSDVINTSGDEDNPIIWLDGKTLFFSSTGHTSIGGYDIFRAVLKDSREDFGKPENIGYPLNSLYDDLSMALTADGRTLYLSAVRDSGLGDYDLYQVKTTTPVVASPMTWICGKAIAQTGGPAKGAIVIVTNVTGATVAQMESNNATGRFDIAVPPGEYKISLRHAKLGKGEASVSATADVPKLVVDVKFE